MGDSSSFAAALPGPAQTVDFDSTAAGTLLPSGSTLDRVTFTYSIAGLAMIWRRQRQQSPSRCRVPFSSVRL